VDLIVLVITSVCILVIISIILRFNLKNIKLIKKIGENKDLNDITNGLPENEQICKEMLKMLHNEEVKVKTGNSNSQASLYIIATNSIIIANIKNTFTRVQTIAHECIHSIQDKRIQWFNFVFSNIYLIYFGIITIIALFNKLLYTNIFAIILVMMSIIHYFVRSYLETDAMIKARYLAKEYMEQNRELIDEENIDIVVKNYDKLNEMGVKYYNMKIMYDCFSKVIIFCLVAIF